MNEQKQNFKQVDIFEKNIFLIFFPSNCTFNTSKFRSNFEKYKININAGLAYRPDTF